MSRETPPQNPMEATEQELKWAAAIKAAAQADESIQESSLSDLEYLQHAIVAKDKVSKALKRIKRMQDFKQTHGIIKSGTYQDALRDIAAFNQAHPGLILALGAVDASSAANTHAHTHVLSFEYSKFLAKSMKSAESFHILLRGLYYYMQATQPNIAAMRAGFCSLADCQSIGWRNFSPLAEEQCAHLYSDAYPIRVKNMVMMNANPLLRVFYNICKVFMSQKIRQTVIFCGSHEEYLKESPFGAPVVLPTVWGGTMDLDTLAKMVDLKLKERYKLEETFKL